MLPHESEVGQAIVSEFHGENRLFGLTRQAAS